MSKPPITAAPKTVSYFWRHCLHYPLFFWGMWLSLPVATFTNRFLPALIVANILDRLSRHDFIPGNVWGSFGPQMALAIALWAIGGIGIWRIVAYCNWKLEGYVARDINQEVFDHLLRLSASFHANHFAGTMVSQATKLIGAFIRITDTALFSTGTLVCSIVFTTVLLAKRAPLFVVCFLTFVLAYMVCSTFMTRRLRVLSAAEAESGNIQTGYLADSVTNIMAVKSFAAGEYESRRYAKRAEKTRLALMSLMRASLLREFAFTGIGTSLNTVALTTAIVSVVVFKANIATVYLIMTYTTLILMQLWEFSTSTLRTFNRALGDAQGMMEVLATEPEVKDPAEPEAPRISQGAIELKNMSFTHPESREDDSLFEKLDLSVAPSEKIGLVGHSGSGKTTLTKLLLRFDDVDGGEILIDGQNIAHLKQDDLRRYISYVPQEPLLFHRTIHENIAFGQPTASEAEIREAAHQAFAEEFIAKLPKGYDTLVGERGVKLSGGQRQRIAIARAILKNAPILVLDEATSALDSESEKLIQAALWKLMEGRTAIVIAHRLSTIQKMDRIIVLDEGKIIEEGTHKELLDKKGIYASLWAHQSGGFIEG